MKLKIRKIGTQIKKDRKGNIKKTKTFIQIGDTVFSLTHNKNKNHGYPKIDIKNSSMEI